MGVVERAATHARRRRARHRRVRWIARQRARTAAARREDAHCRRIYGIGEPGADKILLLTRTYKVLPLDSNGVRALCRIGYGRSDKNYTTTYKSVIAAVTPELVDDYSLADRRTRRCCGTTANRSARPVEPRCEICPIAAACDYAAAHRPTPRTISRAELTGDRAGHRNREFDSVRPAAQSRRVDAHAAAATPFAESRHLLPLNAHAARPIGHVQMLGGAPHPADADLLDAEREPHRLGASPRNPYVSQYTPIECVAGTTFVAKRTVANVVERVYRRRLPSPHSSRDPTARCATSIARGDADARASGATIRHREQLETRHARVGDARHRHAARRHLPAGGARSTLAFAPALSTSAASSGRPSIVVSRRASHAATTSVESPRRNVAI